MSIFTTLFLGTNFSKLEGYRPWACVCVCSESLYQNVTYTFHECLVINVLIHVDSMLRSMLESHEEHYDCDLNCYCNRQGCVCLKYLILYKKCEFFTLMVWVYIFRLKYLLSLKYPKLNYQNS